MQVLCFSLELEFGVSVFVEEGKQEKKLQSNARTNNKLNEPESNMVRGE